MYSHVFCVACRNACTLILITLQIWRRWTREKSSSLHGEALYEKPSLQIRLYPREREHTFLPSTVSTGGLLEKACAHLSKLMHNQLPRLITGTRCSDHISPVLRELHWLPVRELVKFKVACLVHQSLSGQACLLGRRLPSHVWQHSALSGCVRSADVSTCVVPRTLSSYGDRTFAAGTSPVELSSSPAA